MTNLKFTSAYEIQTRDRLTRYQVIELAEVGPSFWRVSESLMRLPDDVQIQMGINISARKMTADGRYYENGHENLKQTTIKDWLGLRDDFRRVLSEYTAQVVAGKKDSMSNAVYIPDDLWDRLKMDEWLADKLPKILTGKEVYFLLQEQCPDFIQADLRGEYTLHSVLKLLDRDDILNLCFLLTNWDEGIWAFIETIDDGLVDLYFSQLFRQNLFFLCDEQFSNSKIKAQPQAPDELPPDISGPLTDLDTISNEIKKAIPLARLKAKEMQYLTALQERLSGATFEQAYSKANPRTKSCNSDVFRAQGNAYCTKAHEIATNKLRVDFDINLIMGRM